MEKDHKSRNAKLLTGLHEQIAVKFSKYKYERIPLNVDGMAGEALRIIKSGFLSSKEIGVVYFFDMKYNYYFKHTDVDRELNSVITSYFKNKGVLQEQTEKEYV